MKNHFKPIGETDTWITPKYITEALGNFDLDPCAHTEMPWQHAKNQYTVKDDGLEQEWYGRVWCNPPFNRKTIDQWMNRMYIHNDGIMLLSAAFETKRFFKYVWGRADAILILNHRPYFCYPDGSKAKANSGQTICLVAYGSLNKHALIDSNLGVCLNEIN